MDKPQQKLKRKSKHQETDKRSLIIGSLIATFLAVTPYLFYLYESVPETQNWDTFLFSYNSIVYESAQDAFWIFNGKAIPLILLLIWFFTCRHWWYHVLLVPIAMYIYQMVSLFNEDQLFIDEYQLINLVPIMAIIIPSIYLIRARMFDKLNTANKTLEDLEAEFTVRPKTIWGKVKQYF